MNWRRLTKIVIRIGFSAGILWFLITQIDIAAFGRLVAGADIRLIVSAALIVLIIRVMMAIRWQLIIVAHGHVVPFREILEISFVSVIFDRVLPGGVGGDLARGYHLSRRIGGLAKLADVAKTVLIDRVIGVYSMFLLALLGGLYVEGASSPSATVIALFAMNAAFVVGWFTRSWFRAWFQMLFRIGEGRDGRQGGMRGKSVRRIAGLALTMTDMTPVSNVLVRLLGLSFAIQFLRCVIFAVVYQSLGASVEIAYFVYFVPLVMVATIMPISIGGLGVREGLLAFFFAGVGVATDVSVGAGLIVFVVQGVAVVPGILLLMVQRGVARS